MNIDTYEVIQLDESSWLIEDSFVRAFLFIGADRALLIDTGTGKGNIATVVNQLTNLPVILVNTHADEDHIGGNHLFSETYMHPSEIAYYSEMRKASDAIPLPLWDGESIDIGGRVFEVILIPGHTPGSIALLDRAHRLLVSGDSISSRPVFIFGKNRNLDALLSSLKKLLSISDSFDTILPSHGLCPIDKSQINKEICCAEMMKRGDIFGIEPPIPINAKMYLHDGAGFYFTET